MSDTLQIYWMVAETGKRLDDFADAEKAVAAGILVYEVPVEHQQRQADLKTAREVAFLRHESQLRQASAERARSASPEGRAEAARRNAGTGGYVTPASSPAILELDAYSADRTNVFE